MRVKGASLLTAFIGVCLVACGGSGGGDSAATGGGSGGGTSGTVPGAGPALSPAQLDTTSAVLRTISQRHLLVNPSLTIAQRLDRLEAFCAEARTAPNVVYADARYGGGTAVVVLADGTPVFYVYNRITNPGGPAVPSAPVTRAGVPNGPRLYVHEPLNEPTVDTIIPAFRARGWTVIHGRGRLVDWLNMSEPGYVFYNGHGTKASRVVRLETNPDGSKRPIFGESEWVMETDSEVSVSSLRATYGAELERGEMYIGATEEGRFKLFVGAKTLEAMRLNGSIVYLNSCLSSSALSNQSKIAQALQKAGAQAYFGYSNISGGNEVAGAILANQIMLGAEPDTTVRPLGAIAAMQEVTRRGLHSHTNWTNFDDEGNYKGNAYFAPSNLELTNLGITNGDAPATSTTTRLEVSPQPGGAQRLRVHGIFTSGPTAKVRVLANGVDLTVLNKTATLIEAELPSAGLGSSGAVKVIDTARESTERNLTRWNGRLVYSETTTGEGANVVQKITMPFTLRLDVQGYRRVANETPRIDAASGLSLPTDVANFELDAVIDGQRINARTTKASDDIQAANIWLNAGNTPRRTNEENLFFVHAAHVNQGSATSGTLRGTLSFLALAQVSVRGNAAIIWSGPGTDALGFGGLDRAARIPFEIDLANYQLKGRTWTKTLNQDGATLRYELKLEAASAIDAPPENARR
ncbi:MAG: hypothetical protein SFX74_09200 [Fimbriimonadaceae bacterium]|nr:hypothetical protein [Fimbriimonadaceae bacterium]